MKKFVLPPLVLIILLVIALPCMAVTIDEVSSMVKEGVSDDVILALIDATGSKFDLTPGDIIQLQKAGVSEDIVLAMINSDKKTEPVQETGDIYLQLSDEQFNRLYLGGDQGSSEYEITDVYNNEPSREPTYYHSSAPAYGQGYISHPSMNSSSYSSGLTQTTYSYVYPGGYQYDRKYYQRVYPPYYGNQPLYYIYNGVKYYTPQYYTPQYYPGYYSPYPLYYKYPDTHYRYYNGHNRHYSGSRARIGYRDDDWYFALGFKF